MHRLSCRGAGTRARSGLAAGALATFLAAFLVVTGASGAQAAAPAWRLVHSPNATVSGGKLEAVSCSSAGACTAVGTDRDAAGIYVTLAERWNGTAWQRQHTPNPIEDTVSDVRPVLSGVSCPTADFCVAVGSYNLGGQAFGLAQVWQAGRWTARRFPVPTDAQSVSPAQVSCTSARFCEAVGSYQNIGGFLTLAATWNGTAWHLQRTPIPAGDNAIQLSAVSCASPAFCEAWGGQAQGSGNPALAEQWNGTSWRLQPVPAGADIGSVACASATSCEAVGFEAAYGWNGSAWAAQTLPSPASSAALTGVSCVSATSCELVGGFNENAEVAAGWNGSTWRAQAVPSPAKSSVTSLADVSCVSAGFCEAAGSYELNQVANDPKTLAETWNGHAWQVQHAVAPPAATQNLVGPVSCVSASFCETVGSYTDGAGNQAALAEQWNGTSWKLQSAPTPPPVPGGGAGETLDGLSCVSASFCEAVGDGPEGGNAEVWNGTSWQLQTRPGVSVTPLTVSCATLDFCMSVNGDSQVDIWNGSSWSADGSVTGFQPVTAVSCVSASFCEALGSGPKGDDAAIWNGSTWTAQAVPTGVSSVLNAVSCTSATSCEAVGTEFSEAGSQTIADSWNGSTWTSQVTANPTQFPSSSLNDVSCTSANACTAVGSSTNNAQTISRTLAEVWNGTTWSLRSTPNRPASGANALDGVSCTASGGCTAVGLTEDIGQIPATLIETGD